MKGVGECPERWKEQKECRDKKKKRWSPHREERRQDKLLDCRAVGKGRGWRKIDKIGSEWEL